MKKVIDRRDRGASMIVSDVGAAVLLEVRNVHDKFVEMLWLNRKEVRKLRKALKQAALEAAA